MGSELYFTYANIENLHDGGGELGSRRIGKVLQRIDVDQQGVFGSTTDSGSSHTSTITKYDVRMHSRASPLTRTYYL